jgi:DNA-binding response OmpR family regulator
MLDSSAKLQRILVVDDDPAILRLLKDELERAGFQVLTATSGQQALDVMDRCGLPHLAIVDIMMPGMDGFEFCRTIQQSTDLPVIMLSAVHEKAMVIRGIEHCRKLCHQAFQPP